VHSFSRLEGLRRPTSVAGVVAFNASDKTILALDKYAYMPLLSGNSSAELDP